MDNLPLLDPLAEPYLVMRRMASFGPEMLQTRFQSLLNFDQRQFLHRSPRNLTCPVRS